jgi:predicted RNase H-like nuclease
MTAKGPHTRRRIQNEKTEEASAMRVVGVDGCNGGWLAVIWDTEQRSLTPFGVTSLSGIIELFPESFIAIDIPIGLSELGDRPCDKEARKMLGKPRSNSVFPPPVPDILYEPTYAAANAASRERIGKGVSQQAFALFPKMREAHELITPALQDRVFEIHPEVSFGSLAGHPMFNYKGKAEGFEERRDLLNREMGLIEPIPERHVVAVRAGQFRAQPDDYLDATVAAWTAFRVATGTEKRLPEGRVDRAASGLRMEMVH